MTTAVSVLQVSLEDPNWTLFRNLGIGLVVVLWLATAYWTFKDARRRIGDPWLVGLATLVGLFPPFLGPIIYMFFRPPEYIQDARERELEIKAMEERLSQLDQRCPVCRAKVEASYLVCPVCTTRLRDRRARRAGSRSSRSGRSARTAPLTSRRACRRSRTSRVRRVERATRLRRRMARETTLVLVKPDGMRRGLAGEIVARFERRGLELRGARLLKIPKATAREHYAEHKGKPFFGSLVDFITSGPVLALAVSGESAISVVRTMMGATNPLDSAPGTIRGDFALELSENIVHGSDSKASARRELALFFPDGLV